MGRSVPLWECVPGSTVGVSTIRVCCGRGEPTMAVAEFTSSILDGDTEEGSCQGP